jgi:hypothetical protein
MHGTGALKQKFGKGEAVGAFIGLKAVVAVPKGSQFSLTCKKE